MSYLVSDLKNDITRLIRGTGLAKVRDIDGLIRQAAGDVQLDFDAPDTKRKSYLANALYDGVYDCVAPSDIKDGGVISLGPSPLPGIGDNFRGRNNEEFGRYRDNNTFTPDYRDGIPYFRISKRLSPPIVISSLDSVDDNGTWATSGVAGNLDEDTVVTVTGGASLRFDLSGAGAGTVQNSDLTIVDLSDHEDLASEFLWLWIPDDAASLTSVSLEWGSTALAYWTATVSATHVGTAFAYGWNLLRFDWSGATQVGSPNAAAITFANVSLNWAGGAQDGFRIDSLVSVLPVPYECGYYSNCLFRGTDGTWKDAPTDDTDQVMLGVTYKNLILYKCMDLLASQLNDPVSSTGKVSNTDQWTFGLSYVNALRQSQSRYKSERRQMQSTYYRNNMNRRRY